jgi:calcineurin-like phosphoesterase family protein
MKKIWIITDTHLGHDNIIKYCNRPENHNELILEGLKAINKGDELIHLGDFCIGKDKEWHEKFVALLPDVKKILILGNHDKQSKDWYLRNGWDFVCEQFSNNYYGKYITFSHIPIKGVQNINIHGHYHNNLPRLLAQNYVVEGEKERNDRDFALVNYNPKLHKLLCIEDENYKPVLLETFINPYPVGSNPRV